MNLVILQYLPCFLQTNVKYEGIHYTFRILTNHSLITQYKICNLKLPTLPNKNTFLTVPNKIISKKITSGKDNNKVLKGATIYEHILI